MGAKERKLWNLNKAQGGASRGSIFSLVSFPPTFFGGGGAGVETGVVFGGPGGGCDIISTGWMGINTT